MVRFTGEYVKPPILQQSAAKLQSIENLIQFVREALGLERPFTQPSLHLARFTIRPHSPGLLGHAFAAIFQSREADLAWP
jgi:hypothetical protein